MGTVGVVGGGVAGLAAAHYLLRKPSVTRCEASFLADGLMLNNGWCSCNH